LLCLPYYAYVISSTKLVIRAEQDLPGTEGGGEKCGLSIFMVIDRSQMKEKQRQRKACLR
jgi:hypothetical protein